MAAIWTITCDQCAFAQELTDGYGLYQLDGLTWPVGGGCV